MPETLREKMVRVGQSFFDLSKEEKMEFAGEKILDPIRYGTSFNLMVDTALFWRDYLKCLVHPHLNAPSKPPGLRYTPFLITTFKNFLTNYMLSRTEIKWMQFLFCKQIKYD